MDTDAQETGWKYTGAKAGEAGNPGSPAAPSTFKGVSWTASEFVSHDKTSGWYVRYALVVVIGIAVIFLFTRDIMSVVLLTVLAIVFAVFAARKPEELNYKLDNRGITIGSKFYPANLFRSFAVVEEGAFHSITLLPLKRFMPAISLYYAPDDEAAIVEAFGAMLPQETRQQDALDKFMHRIRF